MSTKVYQDRHCGDGLAVRSYGSDYSEDCAMPCNCLARRDLRREALLRWMIPRLAALSRTDVALTTAVSAWATSPLEMAARAVVTADLVRVLTERLSWVFFNDTRNDFLLGTVYSYTATVPYGDRSGS